jgi:hypothetical protein
LIKYILIFSQIIAVASCAVADPQIQAPQQDEVIAAKQQINAHKTVKNTDQIVAASNIQPVIDTKQNPELHNQTELTSDLNKKITTNKKSVITSQTLHCRIRGHLEGRMVSNHNRSNTHPRKNRRQLESLF